MKRATETREIITVAVDGVCLRGTYHRLHRVEENRTGVFFLSPGFLPRAAMGDAAVGWADSFAQSGYPSFRFDLPGLGDSDGEPPAGLLDYINAGGYAPILSATAREIVKRFGLSGMVIVGHCAGAVSTLYAAAVTKECKGLVLLDPYFHLPQTTRAKFRNELSRWARWSALGGRLSDVHDRVRHLRRLVAGHQLPKNANRPLLRCWNQVAGSGMPILIEKAPAQKAPGIKPRLGEFDYLGYIQRLAGSSSRIVITFVEGTNHSFADRLGRVAFQQHTERWLKSNFPLLGCDEANLLETVPITTVTQDRAKGISQTPAGGFNFVKSEN